MHLATFDKHGVPSRRSDFAILAVGAVGAEAVLSTRSTVITIAVSCIPAVAREWCSSGCVVAELRAIRKDNGCRAIA